STPTSRWTPALTPTPTPTPTASSGEQLLEQRPVGEQRTPHLFGLGLATLAPFVHGMGVAEVLHEVRVVHRHEIGLLFELLADRVATVAQHRVEELFGFGHAVVG